MESFIAVITSLSSVIGVPASLCLAWAAFIIRDHGKRITTLEADMKEMDKRYTEALKEMDKNRNEELSRLYDRLNKMSDDVSYIRGRIEKEAS